MPETADPPPLSAFTIVRNVSIHEYPVEASVRSALPLVEDFVINVGVSRDDTAERMEALAGEHPEIRLFRLEWEDDDGVYRSLSGETNRAMDRCRHDWALYLQADEVLHEDDRPALRQALARAEGSPRVEGLLFDYLHFYGSPEWQLTGRRTYRREVRAVRRSAGVRSVRDAQGFRVGPEERPTTSGGTGPGPRPPGSGGIPASAASPGPIPRPPAPGSRRGTGTSGRRTRSPRPRP